MRRRPRPSGAVVLTCGKADVGGSTGDLPLDFIERADAVERLGCDRGFRLVPFAMDVAVQMRPACGFAQAGRPVPVRTAKLSIALMAISLQTAAGFGQMAMAVFFLPIRRAAIDRTGRRCPCPRSRLERCNTPIGVSSLARQAICKANLPRGGMQEITGPDIRLDPLDQRGPPLHGAAAPVNQGAVRDIRPHPGEDLVLAIQRKVAIEFGDEDVRRAICPLGLLLRKTLAGNRPLSAAPRSDPASR